MTELERRLTEENSRLLEENRLLRQKVDLLIRQLFGRKSEKLDPNQLELLLSGLEEGEVPGKPEASAAHEELVEEKGSSRRRSTDEGRRPRIPENLPVIEEVIDPEPVRACPEAWRRIGAEVSEQLDYEPGHFFRRRTVRPKYVKRADREAPPIVAPLPPKLIEGGIAAPGLIAQIVTQKYADHLPLYRQEQIFDRRYGVEIPRQTMVRWMEVAADWLRPIYQKMHEEMFAGVYLEVDETPVKYLVPGSGKAQQGYFWAYRVPGGDTLFDWQKGRSHGCLLSFVPESFGGVIHCDGYRAYRTFARKRDGVRLAGCWAHARRKFIEAFEIGESPGQAGWLLRQIQHLYRIEGRLQNSRAGPALREAVRQSQSRPIARRIHRALFRLKARGKILPKSLLGKALAYTLGQWEMLEVYLEDGRVQIDNNLVENAIRPTAIGKKNWLFIGAEGAGWRSAVLYSIVESCRYRGIEPFEYLRDVLTRLPSMTNWQIAEVTPQAWAKAKAESETLAAAS
jgi:transposase